MKVLFTDYDMLDVTLERDIFRAAGITLTEGQCLTEQAVIDAAREVDACLIQYAPMNDKVFSALPNLGLVSRIGAGYDTINTQDAARHGIWIANSPDYGVGEVSLHAMSMLLGSIRGLKPVQYRHSQRSLALHLGRTHPPGARYDGGHAWAWGGSENALRTMPSPSLSE